MIVIMATSLTKKQKILIEEDAKLKKIIIENKQAQKDWIKQVKEKQLKLSTTIAEIESTIKIPIVENLWYKILNTQIGRKVDIKRVVIFHRKDYRITPINGNFAVQYKAKINTSHTTAVDDVRLFIFPLTRTKSVEMFTNLPDNFLINSSVIVR